MSVQTPEIPQLPTKPWYKSKTVWLGIVLTMAGAVPVVSALLQQATISPSDVVMAFGGFLGVVLRVWFTDTPIQK